MQEIGLYLNSCGFTTHTGNHIALIVKFFEQNESDHVDF